MRTKKKRKSAWDHSPSRIASAEAVLRESRRLLRDPERVLATLARDRSVRLPLRTDLGVMAPLFDAIHRGDHVIGALARESHATSVAVDEAISRASALSHGKPSGRNEWHFVS